MSETTGKYGYDGWVGVYACPPIEPWGQPPTTPGVDPFPIQPAPPSTFTIGHIVPPRPFEFNTPEYWTWWKGYIAGNSCTADQMLRAIEEDRE